MDRLKSITLITTEEEILKKRFVIIGLVFCLMLAFAGCGGDKLPPEALQDNDDMFDGPADGLVDGPADGNSVDDNDDTVSISSDADPSNFVDDREVLKEALGVDVQVMLDEFEVQQTALKKGESVGIMLSGLFAETQEWKIDIEDESVVKLTAQGPEKNVVGERQGFDFFSFEALKAGETTVKITDMMKDSGDTGMEHTFTITVIE